MSEREFNEIFSERLRYYLSKYEITQAELAKRLGVGTTSVYNWLHAIKTPRMDKVDMMCEMFHCLRSDLTSEPSAITLTASERELLEKIRALDPTDRARIEERMDEMLEKKTSGMEDSVNVG